MERFDVLDRHMDCFSSKFLEASAGTGKTFAIENIVSRLLLEQDPLDIKEILVITFTKAATRDLRKRIQEHLHKLMSLEDPPDYFLAILEQGEEARMLALSRLQKALSQFEEAQIFTIHAFCLRMLKEHALLFMDRSDDEMLQDAKILRKLVHDFLLNQLQGYSVGQLEILFKKYSEEALIAKIVALMSKGSRVVELPNFSALQANFDRIAKDIDTTGLLEEFLAVAPLYEGVCNKKGELKQEIIDEVSAFLSDMNLDRCVSKGLVIAESLQILKKKSIPKVLSTHLCKILEELAPIVEHARDVNVILARMVGECLKLKEHLDYVDPDEILKTMARYIEQESFVTCIRRRYKASIIDEFQDTDPLQWKIFQKCFSKGLCYLVGDPKQSIYSFRQADIYTYLEAARTFGAENQACLDTNYRSTPHLVEALNALFSRGSPLPLPRLQQTLVVDPVRSAPDKENRDFKDDRGSIHFFIAHDERKRATTWPTLSLEEEYFFPFIVDEVCRLGCLQDTAVLVRDRYQEARLQEFLKKRGIPFISKRPQSLGQTKAFECLHKLFTYFAEPKDHSLLLELLGTPLFGWTHVEIKEFKPIPLFDILQEHLDQKNLAMFFEELFGATAEKILSCDGGLQLYRDLQQIMEKVLESEPEAKEIVVYLNQLKQEEVRSIAHQEENAVNILTLHVSKGLEFGVVFALGLASRTFQDEELILENDVLFPCDKKNAIYGSYIKEKDAEKARQLYVGLTRAKWRLYVPYIVDASDKELEVGTASPIELFLSDVGLIQHLPHVTSEVLSKQMPAVLLPQVQRQVAIAPLEKVTISEHTSWIHSFSSLSRKQELDIVVSPAEDELPLGAETGILLHAAIEKYLMTRSVKGLDEKIVRILEGLLKVSLGSFTLEDVDPAKMLTEVEFLMPQDGHSYLTGFIDLVAWHEGKYYIFDWKSNWLPDYSQEMMERSMQANEYHLQAKIYMLALQQYLTGIEEKPFEEVFGGYYYIFLRGLGVYYGRTC